MKLRRREAVWLLALGGLLLGVRGMDSRTASLRRSASASTAAAAAAAAAAPTAAPTGAVLSAASGEGEAGALMSTADLAGLAWGPNPVRGGAARREAAVAD
ncbi:MAG: hypothetical protein ACYDIE_07985, partial [Candidatus Krumholzibacteriia bacterium]